MKSLLLLMAAICAPIVSASPKPNIIFILTDDMGWGDYGVFFQNLRKEKADPSEPWHLTPALDQMAAEGISFPDHYCPAPVCAPSRASLLLGVHQGHANIRNNQFDKALDDNHTLASVLSTAGYETAAIGKWGLQGYLGKEAKKNKSKGSPAEWEAYPTKRGFDFYHGYVRHSDGHAHYPKEDKKPVWENDTEISADLKGCYTTDLFTARAKKWIIDHREKSSAKPFFLYLAYDTPHAALQLASQPYPKGGGTNGGIQWTGEKGNMINTAGGTPDSFVHPDYASATWDHDKNPATPEQAWPDVYQRYASMVRRIDECVGDLLKTLTDLGIDDETLVIFTSDNGPSKESYMKEPYNPDFFNSFGSYDGIKRDVLEGGIRVGAILRWQGTAAPGTVSHLPSQFHDWMPTFCELAGFLPPARADGTSLVPTITGKGKQKTPQVYIEYENNSRTPDYKEFTKEHRNRNRGQMQAIRFSDFMGVRYGVKSHADPFEIYNVTTDPQQKNNLAASMPEMQQQMHDAVLRMRRPNSTSKRPYDAEFIPSIEVETESGVKVESSSIKSPWLARTNLMSADSEVISKIIPSHGNDTLRVSGYIDIPADGTYTFHLSAGATALLRIHEATVIDCAYKPSENESAGEINLARGKHPFRLYLEGKGSGKSLEISGKGMSRQPIPENMLGHGKSWTE
ncbi:MAG: sulfatase-like hydrolase/transferase [Akkermansiaceae bacterium]|jgi:arylsulfatase A-like enzyme|nr:sulfatase-like hydrolase/transferase [Akkermansiaceae bacterium]MDP4647655.1 sulfatase-like hydrolase/transferase [Akkermansiaceae bacterium]MDP4722286.1 sulfatase-like hydrolase/transferase [Akkermansiaceae bacterium]MDP4780326.1 sulfatase-like hydrolase/transferase [Akkermansiaceae bacterium]MDP4846190.1 sulfatase-like hydrolase/transferase [Akkermansiaceae bacterium]